MAEQPRFSRSGDLPLTGSRGTPRRLSLALAVVVLAAAGCTPMDDAMVAIFGRSMRRQPSIESYEGPYGTRNPPEGAVSFASGNFPAAPGQVNIGQAEGTAIPGPTPQSQLAQVSLENPVPADPASLERGQQMFERVCSPCHGTVGAGDGSVGQVNEIFARSLLTQNVMDYSDGQIYSIIRVGRPLMPPYGHQVSHYDRWHIVNYLRELQGQ